ncbi:MAG: adenosine kinase [Inquilinus sp.]|nr:adenosine kinase [Inquilinus sp.]
MSSTHHVLGIGNAIVDVLAHADDAFIERNDLNKGAMTLIDAETATALYAKMGPAVEISGGSAANTVAGVASLGGRAVFIGKVCDDQLGEVFRHDIRAVGVDFDTRPIAGSPPTARSLILVTPDSHRTMNTMLGACVELGPEDIDPAVVGGAEITYLEGYLWDKPTAKEAFLKAAAIAHDSGRRVSLTLSDPFCVDRHRDSFRTLIAGHIDILFGNEHEVMALYQVDTLEAALDRVRGECAIAAITRSEAGSLVLHDGRTEEVPAEPVAALVDSTGAGDLYAAGFLYGLTAGRAPAECGRLGSIAAAEVIGHIGARPEASLAELVATRA